MAAPDEPPVARYKNYDKYLGDGCLNSGLNFDVEAYIIYLLDPQDIFALGKVSKSCYSLTGQFGSALSYIIRRGRETLVRQDSKAALWYMWKNWPRSAKGHDYTDPYTGWESTPYETVLAKEKELIDRIVDELRLDELFLGTRKIEQRRLTQDLYRRSYADELAARPLAASDADGSKRPERTYVWYATSHAPNTPEELTDSLFGGSGPKDMNARVPNAALMGLLRDFDKPRTPEEGGAGNLTVRVKYVTQATAPLILRMLPFVTRRTDPFVMLSFVGCPNLPSSVFTDETIGRLQLSLLLKRIEDTLIRMGRTWLYPTDPTRPGRQHQDGTDDDVQGIKLPEKRK
jgi:hypothetical protein